VGEEAPQPLDGNHKLRIAGSDKRKRLFE